MGAIALGNFLGGVTEGYTKARKLAMDEERQGWERDEQDEKKKAREAKTEFQTAMEKLRQDRANGMLPGGDDNLTEAGQQYVSSLSQQQEQQGAPKAIAAPAGTAPADGQAQPAPTAIATPDAAQPPAAQQPKPQENRMANLFKSGGEGLYKNQKLADDAYYNGVRDVTARYLEKTGQLDKLATLDKQINDMRDSAYEPIRKAAAAALASGQPNAMKLAAHAMSLTGLPIQYDENSGTFDGKTMTWKGVKSRLADGKEHVEDISVPQMLNAIGMLDAGRLVEYQIGRNDKDRQFGLEERKVRAEEASAGATASFRKAQERALEDNVKGSNTKALAETLNKQFPLANSEMDTTKMLGKSKEEIARRQQQIDDDTQGLALAERLVGLNPKADPRVVAAAAKSSFGGGMSLMTDPASKRKYIEYGGTKIFTN